MCRWADRISPGNRGCLSPDRDSAVHHPSDQEYNEVCFLQGAQAADGQMCIRDRLGTVNVFTNNSTSVKRDEELVAWFMETYQWLLDDPSVEVLYEKTDFGVGD